MSYTNNTTIIENSSEANNYYLDCSNNTLTINNTITINNTPMGNSRHTDRSKPEREKMA